MRLDAVPLDFHDSVLDEVAFDAGAQTATIRLQIYPTTDAKTRTPATLTFEGVRTLSMTADADALARHAAPGNVGYFRHQEGRSSYLFLVAGCLAIEAKRVHLSVPGFDD